nr:hypothetical protein HUO10_005299 [Paraburkholderia busanensis]
MRALFIDDYLETAEALAGLAILMGHDALSASDCDEALALAMGSRPDIVFADIRPGRQDGRELCRRLKLLPTLAGTRYIGLTGLASVGLDDDPDLFEEILSKPVGYEDLERLLGAGGKA